MARFRLALEYPLFVWSERVSWSFCDMSISCDKRSPPSSPCDDCELYSVSLSEDLSKTMMKWKGGSEKSVVGGGEVVCLFRKSFFDNATCILL